MTREYKVNQDIKANRVNLVLTDGTMRREVSVSEAILVAEEENLDLVEVSAGKGKNLSVCKMIDYGKMMYQQSKKDKTNKHVQHTKEIKYSFNISDHDLEVKHKQVEKFLSKHYVVRYVLELRGREKSLTPEALQKMDENLVQFEEIATWKHPQVSGGGKRVEISTTLRYK
jgi:translation initiation factor IF-3